MTVPNRDYDWSVMRERVHEPVVADPVGTIRVSERFGSIAVYVKVGEDIWRTTYVDPRNHNYLIPSTPVGDVVAGMAPVVYVPKPVE